MKSAIVSSVIVGLFATSALAQNAQPPRTVSIPAQTQAITSGTTSQTTPRLDTDKDPHKAHQDKDVGADQAKATPPAKPAEQK